ncbi:NtaA/DmoA family FMN-dependent monooxygenase [Rhodococcus sp. 008]|uniref:NtaA/DmoA family FMN-dependent monooxygenase n=1 Tax=Rhodococcus sp. 008 TaxID=1723645 RepID=UPI0008062075|nr:NtaA/DmoA family FMN-dependent monooxygenase [Rhodococcus sp. 008]ANQ72505.1 F420-dependent methylene-tetrahydromethanopterin reductase [Rhodococcus sp. 008]
MTQNRIRKQVHLGAHFPGVNNTTVWTDPASKSQIEFSSFEHLARSAERGLFDFFFLAEGLRLREHQGKIHDLDVVGRPDTFSILNAVAGVTTHLGLAGTINTTFNEPYELAKQFSTLDHLSDGRAAWNLVTSSDAFTGENFRRGGYLEHSERYARANELVDAVRTLWDSWSVDRPIVDRERGVFATDQQVGQFQHSGKQFDIAGRFEVPRSPQGHPVLLQAGDSDEGREFGAAKADAIFTGHGTLEAGKAFYADVKGRLAKYGRTHADLKILPAATFVLGDNAADAQEKAHHIRRQQVGPQTAIAFLEQVWGRDLSQYDADGPLPKEDPSDDVNITRGRVRHVKDPRAVADQWRAKAEAENLSIRELIIEVTARQQFVGSAAEVAAEIDSYVQGDASDGFILVPHITPAGLDEFIDTVVPELQDRGSFRTEYSGTTLRSHLGLRHPHEQAEGVRAS